MFFQKILSIYLTQRRKSSPPMYLDVFLSHFHIYLKYRSYMLFNLSCSFHCNIFTPYRIINFSNLSNVAFSHAQVFSLLFSYLWYNLHCVLPHCFNVLFPDFFGTTNPEICILSNRFTISILITLFSMVRCCGTKQHRN